MMSAEDDELSPYTAIRNYLLAVGIVLLLCAVYVYRKHQVKARGTTEKALVTSAQPWKGETLLLTFNFQHHGVWYTNQAQAVNIKKVRVGDTINVRILDDNPSGIRILSQ